MTEGQQIVALLTEIRDLIKQRPAPASSAAPQGARPQISYTKLKDGSWGVRCASQQKPGDRVQVTTKDNKVRTETIDRVVWSGPDRQGSGTVWVCSVVPHAKKGSGPAARSAEAAPPASDEASTEAPPTEEEHDVPFLSILDPVKAFVFNRVNEAVHTMQRAKAYFGVLPSFDDGGRTPECV